MSASGTVSAGIGHKGEAGEACKEVGGCQDLSGVTATSLD